MFVCLTTYIVTFDEDRDVSTAVESQAMRSIVYVFIWKNLRNRRYTPLTYLNMKSMTLGNLENFLKQKNKKTKKYKKAGIFALLDE